MILSKLYKEVAEELNIDKTVVEYVIKYVFVYIRNQIRTLSNKDILIHYFGSFSIKQYKIDKYNEYIEKQKANE